MRQHTKQIGVKLFDDEMKTLNSIIKNLKCKNEKCSTSDAIREALRVYSEFGQVSEKIDNQKKIIEENTKAINDLYFKIDLFKQ